MKYDNLVKTKKELRRERYSWFGLFGVIFFIIFIKYITLREYSADYVLATYSIAVAAYILLRFGLSYLYEPVHDSFDYSYEPTVTFSVPVYNEEENIYETITKIARTAYPKEKFDVIAINDGSKDGTLEELNRAKRTLDKLGIRFRIVDRKKNRGKREGMAETVKMTKSEVIVFVDSDSFIEKDTLREMVKYFRINEKVGGVSAHTYVCNSNENLLTKLQGIHYFLSYKVFKGTESLFGTVTCCPGCCSAYKVACVKPNMDEWAKEVFLGVRCTYGDDRSLTNFLLKNGYRTYYAPTARARTIVPSTLKQFFKQQLRWKKSWTRETLLASKYFWKMNPVMVFIFYIGMILTFLTPFIALRAIFWYPIETGHPATSYLIGLFLTSGVFSFFYRAHTLDKKWYYGLVYSFFYSLTLSWFLLYAIPTLRDQKWGTR